ncbi:MAG: hypothetical protein J6Q61_04560, partial [Bacteroidales bacterium]|nr:hypothetical protein [Bacteroidales bacterium]
MEKRNGIQGPLSPKKSVISTCLTDKNRPKLRVPRDLAGFGAAPQEKESQDKAPQKKNSKFRDMTDLNVQIQSSTLPNVQAELEKTTAEACEIQVPEPLKAQYAYLEKLGKGSQGQVWLAERKSDGERVAIKQLNVH